MRFLRENRKLIYIGLTLPLFFFYLDSVVAFFLKNYYRSSSELYRLLELADPPVNFISHGSTVIVAGIILCSAGWLYNKRFLGAGKALLIGFAASGIAAQLIKHLAGRLRPRLTDDLVFMGPTFKGGYDSFPSGHATVAFCSAYILASYFPRYRGLFYMLAVIIGLERVEGIAHFPSDVLAGAIIGIAVAKLLASKLGFAQSRGLPAYLTVQEGNYCRKSGSGDVAGLGIGTEDSAK